MRALVVYESMFGNSAAVARAVADALAEHMSTEVVEVASAPPEVPPDVDLLVVGAPTHAFSLSRRSTRAEAHKQGAAAGSEEIGIREWLGELPRGRRVSALATFDTRAERVRRMPGSAAAKAARIARDRGLGLAVARTSFYVADVAGPLLPDELDRARAWGADLAGLVATRRQVTAGDP